MTPVKELLKAVQIELIDSSLESAHYETYWQLSPGASGIYMNVRVPVQERIRTEIQDVIWRKVRWGLK